MKKILVVLILVTLLSACAKKNSQGNVPPVETPAASPQATSQVPENKGESSVKPSGKDLEALVEKLEKTENEEERKKILADIQVILEGAEKQNK